MLMVGDKYDLNDFKNFKFTIIIYNFDDVARNTNLSIVLKFILFYNFFGKKTLF